MKSGDCEWCESCLYCTRCDEVVAQRSWPNGFVMMRCQCIKKAGHSSIRPARSWIDKDWRGDTRARNRAILNTYSTAFFD